MLRFLGAGLPVLAIACSSPRSASSGSWRRCPGNRELRRPAPALPLGLRGAPRRPPRPVRRRRVARPPQRAHRPPGARLVPPRGRPGRGPRPGTGPADLDPAWRVVLLGFLFLCLASTVLWRMSEEVRRYRLAGLTDPGTRLWNRDALYGEIAERGEAFRRGKGRGFGLLLADVDRFKEWNDARGHLAGDRLLLRAARALLDASRPQDFVARYGGDEYAVVVGEVDGETSPGARLATARRARRRALRGDGRVPLERVDRDGALRRGPPQDAGGPPARRRPEALRGKGDVPCRTPVRTPGRPPRGSGPSASRGFRTLPVRDRTPPDLPWKLSSSFSPRRSPLSPSPKAPPTRSRRDAHGRRRTRGEGVRTDPRDGVGPAAHRRGRSAPRRLAWRPSGGRVGAGAPTRARLRERAGRGGPRDGLGAGRRDGRGRLPVSRRSSSSRRWAGASGRRRRGSRRPSSR